jgi:hypothetical protein
MPRDKNLRKKHYNQLCERDGGRCRVCGKRPPEVYLEVDHIDGNKENNHQENLQLLCRTDNRKKNPRGKGKGGVVKRRVVSADNYREVMDQTRMSPEMYQNSRAEPAFRHWLYKRMKENGRMPVQQIVFAGAEYARCSTYAIRTNYLPKATSEEGMYVRYYDEEKKLWMVTFRNAAAIGVMMEAIDFEIVNDGMENE